MTSRTLSGIYCIRNKITGNSYIGSSQNIRRRFQTHKSELKNKRHHNYKLQTDWNSLGSEAFEFSILIICDLDMRLEIEQMFLSSFKPFYNISADATAPMAGRAHSKETRSKMANRVAWNKGIPRTEAEKQLMSQNRKGIPCPEHIKAYLRTKTGKNSYWFGKKMSDAVRKKVSENIPKKAVKCSNGKTFRSQLDAAKELGVRQGHISEVCKGKRKTAGGYEFWYV